MSVRRRAHRTGGVLLAAGLSVIAHRSANAQQDRLVWSVTVSPSCGDATRATAALREELTLACEAAGATCSVAHDGAVATHVAALTCSPSGAPQSLDARAAMGAHLWSVDLDGETDDRLRRAALWIARSDREASPDTPKARIAAAPESATAEGSARSPQPFGVALSGRAAAHGGAAPIALGLRAVVSYGWVHDLHVGLTASGERAMGDASGYTITFANVGAVFGWGAPFGSNLFGVSLDAGAALAFVDAPPTIAPTSQRFALPYAELRLTARAPGRGAFRPFLSGSLLAQSRAARLTESSVDVARIPAFAGALDVGVAWRPF